MVNRLQANNGLVFRIADMVTRKLDVREAAVRLPTQTSFPSQGGGGSPGNTLDSGLEPLWSTDLTALL